MKGYRGTGASFSPALTGPLAALPAASAPLPNSDVLSVRVPADMPGLGIVAPMASTLAAPQVAASSPANTLAMGDIVLIASCKASTMFQVTEPNPAVDRRADARHRRQLHAGQRDRRPAAALPQRRDRLQDGDAPLLRRAERAAAGDEFALSLRRPGQRRRGRSGLGRRSPARSATASTALPPPASRTSTTTLPPTASAHGTRSSRCGSRC